MRRNAERPLYSGSVAQADRRDASGAETGQSALGAEPSAGPLGAGALGAGALGAEPGGTAQLDRPVGDDLARAGDTGDLPAGDPGVYAGPVDQSPEIVDRRPRLR